MVGSGTTALIIFNEKVNGIMKIMRSLEESGLIIKGVSEIIKNEAKEQKGVFLRMLLGTVGACLLRNLLVGNGTIGSGKGTIRAGEQLEQLQLVRIFNAASSFNKL